MFAMKKAVGNALFVPRLQSSVFWARAVVADLSVSALGLFLGGAVSSAVALAGATRDGCLEECAARAVSATAALRSVVVDPTGFCTCYDVSPLEYRFDDPTNAGAQVFDVSTTPVEMYVVQFCEFTRPDVHGRSLVWTKRATLPAYKDTCVGSPAGLGYVLTSGSVLESYHSGQSSAPFDVLCADACRERDDCAYAHVFAETMQSLDLAHQKPPPPSPPSPPPPPPVRTANRTH